MNGLERLVLVKGRHFGVTRCWFCGRRFSIPLTKDQFNELGRPHRRNIEVVLHDKDEHDRELFVSGTCKDCWERITGQ